MIPPAVLLGKLALSALAILLGYDARAAGAAP
jgi:hypothetical protein